MQLSIKADFAGVQRALDRLQADVGRKALASALNKTVAKARTSMIKEIRTEFQVTATYVRQRLIISKAYASGRLRLSASLAASNAKGRSANIVRFISKAQIKAGGRKRGKPATLRVRVKRGAYKPLAGAFIGNKGRTVFERVAGKQMRARPGKLNKHTQAIKAVRTIDVSQMFNTRRINARVLQVIRAELPRIFDNEAAFYIAKFNRA